MGKLHLALDQRRWRRVRREVLARDNWTCQCQGCERCGPEGCGKFGNECHHVQALDRGGKPYAKSNLTIRCRGCHIQLTREQNTRPDPARDAWRVLVAERMADSVI